MLSKQNIKWLKKETYKWTRVVKWTLLFPEKRLGLSWKLVTVFFDNVSSVFLGPPVPSLSWNRPRQKDERQKTQWTPFIRAIYHKVEYRRCLAENNTFPPSFVIHIKRKMKKKKQGKCIIDNSFRDM